MKSTLILESFSFLLGSILALVLVSSLTDTSNPGKWAADSSMNLVANHFASSLSDAHMVELVPLDQANR